MGSVYLCVVLLVGAQVSIATAGKYDQKISTIPMQDDVTRIVGGAAAANGLFPWQVALTTNGGLLHCGGALITQEYILTAAWCVQGFDTFTVILGAFDLYDVTNVKIKVNASDVVINPEYVNTAREHDIALIRINLLMVTLPKAALIMPIRLPLASQTKPTSTGSLARIAGFGQTADGNVGSTSRFLRWVEVPVMDSADCSAALQGWNYGVTVSDTMMCTAGSGGKGPCSSDRGGALVSQVDGTWTVIGVLSYLVDDECTKSHPAVYTRVTSHLQWIHATTGSGTASLSVYVNMMLVLVAVVVGRQYC